MNRPIPSLVQSACDKLGLTQSPVKQTIFVYSAPKVGSTSLITTFRVFATHIFNTVHIHDEAMLRVLGNIRGVTVMDIVRYTHTHLHHRVFVLDVFRPPVERKISVFFEKIDTLHFNAPMESVAKFPMRKIIRRFNQLFPHIGTGDRFLDDYDIVTPPKFDCAKKFLKILHEGITYVKLRLCDSPAWPGILSQITGAPIGMIVSDYMGEDKDENMRRVYRLFKEQYRLPSTYVEQIQEDPHVNYFFSDEEKKGYMYKWSNRSTPHNPNAFTPDQFTLYMTVSEENQAHPPHVQTDHYRDHGCRCPQCTQKRMHAVMAMYRSGFKNSSFVRVLHDYPSKARK